MAKKNHTLGKFLALTTTVAAIGGACYVFRDQIKESNIYKKSSDKISKLFKKACDKVCPKSEEDFFFDDEEDFYSESMFSDDAKKNREYTSITINSKETADTAEDLDTETIPDAVDDTDTEDIPESGDAANAEDIPEPANVTNIVDFSSTTEKTTAEDMKEIFPEENIPTISFGTDSKTPSSSEPTASDTADAISKEDQEVSSYENEGLSDVSEDPDVLEEQDRLDF